MEPIEPENPNTKTILITVEGLTPESAKAIQQQFISWLCNSGEQDFWMAAELNDEMGQYTIFNYDFSGDEFTPWIVIKEYAPKDDSFFGPDEVEEN